MLICGIIVTIVLIAPLALVSFLVVGSLSVYLYSAVGELTYAIGVIVIGLITWILYRLYIQTRVLSENNS